MKYLILLLLLVSACSSKVVETEKKEAPKKQEVKKQEKIYSFRWNNKAWDKYLVNAIKKSKLMEIKAKDYKDFGKFNDPIEFYGNILVEMAKFESNWKTNATYKENFPDRQGNNVISSGLFQVSLESGRGYKCPFKVQNDLFSAKNNIECAVLIMERWLQRDGVIRGKVNGKWRGSARYWSVIRGTTSGHTRRALKAIQGANK